MPRKRKIQEEQETRDENNSQPDQESNSHYEWNLYKTHTFLQAIKKCGKGKWEKILAYLKDIHQLEDLTITKAKNKLNNLLSHTPKAFQEDGEYIPDREEPPKDMSEEQKARWLDNQVLILHKCNISNIKGEKGDV